MDRIGDRLQIAKPSTITRNRSIMNTTLDAAHRQANLIRTRCSQSSFIDVFNALTSDELLSTIESLLPDHRERLFPPTETLAMFVSQALSADRSCQAIVNQAAVQRLAGGLPQCSTHNGGYCRARQRLPLGMVRSLARHLGSLMHQQVPDDWQWYQRNVRIIDGTTVTMPDTPANQAAYPQQRSQTEGLGFPICRVLGVTCLATGALLNAAIGAFAGKGGDEQSLLRSLQETFDFGDILLGDAYFASYFFIAEMQAKGVDLLMEQMGGRKRVTDFRRGRHLGERDHLITFEKPKRKPQWMSEEQYHCAPASITVRELKAGGKILVTTLTCPITFPKDALKRLYQLRWSVELDIRDIKDTMGMGILSCKTPDMVVKEIWTNLLAYNLIRFMMVQSALLLDILPRSISFKHSLQLWLCVQDKVDQLDPDQYRTLLRLMAQQRVGDRPGRIEPRAVKRRPKPIPLLMKPRHLARLEILKYGHPQKLK